MLALRGTFQALIGSLPEVVPQFPTMSAEIKPITIPYPFEAAVAQINTVLDIANSLLRIEYVGRSRARIKHVLSDEDIDSEI